MQDNLQSITSASFSQFRYRAQRKRILCVSHFMQFIVYSEAISGVHMYKCLIYNPRQQNESDADLKQD